MWFSFRLWLAASKLLSLVTWAAANARDKSQAQCGPPLASPTCRPLSIRLSVERLNAERKRRRPVPEVPGGLCDATKPSGGLSLVFVGQPTEYRAANDRA